MKTSRFILIFLLAFVGSTMLWSCKSNATTDDRAASPTTRPSSTPTQPPTSTSTLQSTATRFPTRTPQPTTTERPSPTPEPAGFYIHNQAGFSLTFPNAIDIDRADDVWVSLNDSLNQIFFKGMGFYSDPEYDFNFMIDVFYGNDYTSRSEPFELTFGKAKLQAQAVKISFENSDGSQSDSQAIYYDTGKRFYFFAVIGDPGFLEANSEVIKGIYDSITLFPPPVFDLPRPQTLSLLGYDPNLEDLDPQQTTSGASDYIGLLFAGLVRLDQRMNVVPDLAESWRISPDGTVYTFTLRSNLTFANGDHLTAGDVIYSWERAADPETNSPSVKTYLGDILGVTARFEGKAESISGLKAIDEHTLAVILDAPKPYFLLKLTFPVAYIVDRANVENGGENWMFNPNSSGPYVIEEYVETERLIFSLNERYHAPPTIPYIGYLLNPGGSAISRYEDDSIDMVYVGGETALRVHRVEDPLHSELISVPSLCTSYVAMNNTLPPFDDPLVRKAFLLAFDRDIFIKRISRGLDLPAVSLLPPAMPGYLTENAVPDFDPEAAKAALAASRYADNMPEVVLEDSGFGGGESSVVNALADMWRRTLGVDVKVVFLDPINFIEAAREFPAHMTTTGWCADYPDPQNFFEPLFKTGAEFNTSDYSNSALDDLLAQANVEADRQRRLELYQQAEKLLLDDFGVIPLTHNISEVLVKPRILGFTNSPISVQFIHDIMIDANEP